MHWADIHAALIKNGWSSTKVAKKAGISSVSVVSEVIRGDKTSHNIAYVIAEITGIPTERLWPGKYLTPPAYEEARKGHKAGRLPKEAVNA